VFGEPLQQARLDPSETVGEVKRPLHLAVSRGEPATQRLAIGLLEQEEDIMAAA